MQIGNSLLLSKKYQALSAGAKVLYLCMALESGGRREFTFPLSSATKYGIAKASFNRYLSELVGSGFLTKQSGKNLRAPNDYQFCSSWKETPL